MGWQGRGKCKLARIESKTSAVTQTTHIHVEVATSPRFSPLPAHHNHHQLTGISLLPLLISILSPSSSTALLINTKNRIGESYSPLPHLALT